MDPNAALTEIRDKANEVLNDGYWDADTAIALAELVRALDEWLSKGGFLPESWAGFWIRHPKW